MGGFGPPWLLVQLARGACLAAGLVMAGAVAGDPEPAPSAENALCLNCHGMPGFAMPGPDGAMRALHVDRQRFGASVHGQQACTHCHQDIDGVPHQKGVEHLVGCVQCHRDLWDQAQRTDSTDEHARLGEVVEQIERYMNSVHARPSMVDQSHTNATCYHCHDAHYVDPINGDEPGRYTRLNSPAVCGSCHAQIRDDYLQSVHGTAQGAGNVEAAVCIDCHTPHNIDSPTIDSIKLAITQNCGNCHQQSLRSYMGTYHGQVNTLGYAFTAKCYDCHGSHQVQPVADPRSRMHESNRLETCRGCHEEATAGYASFQPHGTSHDFDKYPQMWIATKFMIGLLIGTFAFFWLHSALWYYREWRDRKQGKHLQRGPAAEAPAGQESVYFRRFPRMWRLAHLVGALSIMTLVLTGIAVLYAESAWATVLMSLLGGPKWAALIHRAAALGFIGVFFAHLVYLAWYVGRNYRTFRWFGPNSLIPNWQDFKDIAAMFRWFIGRGPRPEFERWTYWEKFDYWAPFWGMTIIGISGMMMWFPSLTAEYLPGWVFNVATIVHGEEAFLAAVFLFTVHFFNNHFRPDNFPQEITMFTGAMPLETYRREHELEYRRLRDSGELDRYLVAAPSRRMTAASKVLGAVLILVGLALLTLVLLGFLGI